MENVLNKIEEFIEPFKDFVIKNNRNPIFWLCAILIGLAIFSIVYNSLHRD